MLLLGLLLPTLMVSTTLVCFERAVQTCFLSKPFHPLRSGAAPSPARIDTASLRMLLHIHCFNGKTDLSALVDTQEVQC